jgi:hypothetical protein
MIGMVITTFKKRNGALHWGKKNYILNSGGETIWKTERERGGGGERDGALNPSYTYDRNIEKCMAVIQGVSKRSWDNRCSEWPFLRFMRPERSV